MLRTGMWAGGLRPCLSLRDFSARSTTTTSHPVTYHPDFRINPIPDGHRFPMPKDHLLWERLQAGGLGVRTFTPAAPDVDTLCLAHDPAYVHGFLQGTLAPEAMRRIGLPWSEELARRTLIGVGSAVLAARLALQFGVACMCNGGTHHAHRAHGSGWCVFNDLAVAARSVQRDAGVGRILFVDLDVHQGDGTAAIFAADDSGAPRSPSQSVLRAHAPKISRTLLPRPPQCSRCPFTARRSPFRS